MEQPPRIRTFPHIMMPLSDHFPTRTTPLITWALIAACVAAYLLQLSPGTGAATQQAVTYNWGFIPAFTLGGAAPTGPAALNPGWPTLFTSMFMHGSWLHLGGNMLYLWIFADNLEDRLGKLRFLAFYLLCGIAAALTQGLLDPTSTVPMVGASGAISGVMGGYILLYPQQTITTLVPRLGTMQQPAWVVLGSWFAYQFFYGISSLSNPTSGGVAFFAHVGGFVAGLALIKLFALGTTPHPGAAVLRAAPPRPRLWS